ncbi:peroxide stress protein YaaA [Microbacterium sp. NPDC076911]|uniref:YaaA family protein n=1 Tax=Microbacterium sp. NPDC076911 TaxID=3154958 RepID=UPI00341C417B
MLILLPPSETKRPGGSKQPLDLTRLSYSSLTSQREAVIESLVALSDDPRRAARVLKLGPKQIVEVAVNAQLRESLTMPAVDRYTGVLFDALDASTLDGVSRRWLGAHVRIHSAPFGPIGALETIPSYRLGAAASLPGIPSLKRVWAEAVSAAISQDGPRFVLDMRSEAYVALGPVPATVPSVYVRVVSHTAEGEVRALNHFNKHAKGALVRLLATSRPRVSTLTGFMRWAESAGVQMRVSNGNEVLLIV